MLTMSVYLYSCVYVDICTLINIFSQDVIKSLFWNTAWCWFIIGGKKWQTSFQEKTCWSKIGCFYTNMASLSISHSQDYCRIYVDCKGAWSTSNWWESVFEKNSGWAQVISFQFCLEVLHLWFWRSARNI